MGPTIREQPPATPQPHEQGTETIVWWGSLVSGGEALGYLAPGSFAIGLWLRVYPVSGLEWLGSSLVSGF